MSEEIKDQEVQEVQGAEVSQEESMADVTFIKKGDIVKGKVIKVDADQAFVDVGYKYDGVVPVKELSSVQVDDASQNVEIGQEIELKVLTIDDHREKLVLSKRAVDGEKSWDKLAADMENKTILEAKVAEVVKGGLVVDVGLRGFVPASMVERTFVEDFSDYKGRTLRLRVKEMDREKNKVILSQKDVLDEEFEGKKKEVLAKLSVGQVLDGTVQRLTQFGAFVDIGGVDGLVHISEMAWHHVEKPSEVVKEGDKVQVQVLKVDPENERISLSIKATQPGPWQQVAGRINTGDIVTGTVKRLVQFGAFIEVAPGVEGLVHISQIAHRHVATPQEVLKEGEEVKVKVLDMNPDEKRISLSIKETEEAPAREPRQERERGDRERAPRRERESVSHEELSSLNLTLGERFGDKLSKFK
ncbi:30S ribosomal protein S1 [Paenibacillus mucilaginosus]|uniref:RNA binding S1 domain-containing protein n=3 Tax=Paenibacillus mucilaginosus TaxID=61624 RepID=H6NMK6_9BACL|nr:30S ribosomal protein S1 [Paenibacillus mucilaginosus]AEI41322.1 RNA binding S1 domain protein [Paenibacillus mucilaginosus KNP414]AFC29872.1 RNA binding S1 domain-containing protein [Paenibacillus mucilaginosus 3016]AFH62057.1 30S ribosomal protein S1 [Paenibacillus mucilaginosus K02]MCG7211257.1 30S ribosomal protein S1 [Paenibacillus mucilaginosus]WDM30352.1 30S ribosomal protein S1 [Paenibacillus mucilaginosus]